MCERFEYSVALRIMIVWNHSSRTPQPLKLNALLAFETSKSVDPVTQHKVSQGQNSECVELGRHALYCFT